MIEINHFHSLSTFVPNRAVENGAYTPCPPVILHL